MILVIDIKGEPTEEHCSQTSSINACQFLDSSREKCKMFNERLIYDFDAHAYKKCEECKRCSYFKKRDVNKNETNTF